jgi:hypothetical protein
MGPPPCHPHGEACHRASHPDPPARLRLPSRLRRANSRPSRPLCNGDGSTQRHGHVGLRAPRFGQKICPIAVDASNSHPTTSLWCDSPATRPSLGRNSPSDPGPCWDPHRMCARLACGARGFLLPIWSYCVFGRRGADLRRWKRLAGLQTVLDWQVYKVFPRGQLPARFRLHGSERSMQWLIGAVLFGQHGRMVHAEGPAHHRG